MNKLDELGVDACAKMLATIEAMRGAVSSIDALPPMDSDADGDKMPPDVAAILEKQVLPCIPDMLYAMDVILTIRDIFDIRHDHPDPSGFVGATRAYVGIVVKAMDKHKSRTNHPLSRAIIDYCSHVKMSVANAALADARATTINDN